MTGTPRLPSSSLTAIASVLAVLVLVPVRPGAHSPTQTQAPAAVPAAAEVIARHVRAIGGAAAYKKAQSLRLTGRFEIPAQGVGGPVVIVSARPDRMRLSVEISGVGTIQSGFTGRHGWSIDPLAGASLQSGRELQETKDDSWFDATLYEPDYVKTMGEVTATEFDKRPAYSVKLTLQSGSEQTHYFDVERGHQIGSDSVRQTPLGILPVSSIFRNYRPSGDLHFPSVLVQRTLGIEQVVTIETVEIDVVAADAFDPPAEIRALIKGPAAR